MNNNQTTVNTLNKGDVIKTSPSDKTIVLEINSNDALLFTGHDYCLAKGIQAEPDKDTFLDFGDYFDEMPITKGDKRHSLDEMKNR